MAIVGNLQLDQHETKYAPLRHHLASRQYTASGYGRKIPTSKMVKYCWRWRRIYVYIFSNTGTAYITRGKDWIVCHD